MHGLGDVGPEKLIMAGQVGNRAGHPQHPVQRTCRPLESAGRAVQQRTRFLAGAAVAFDLGNGQAGVQAGIQGGVRTGVWILLAVPAALARQRDSVRGLGRTRRIMVGVG